MTKKESSSNTQIKIINAANKIVLDHGADALTIESVARQAGLSKGGLLYHFPSKRGLIAGMIAHLIARVDAILKDELKKNNENFVEAYIHASFRKDQDEQRISNALIAALANDPDLVKPLQERFLEMQSKMAEAAPTPEIGTITRLALDGLWLSELFGFAPPPIENRAKIMNTLLELNQEDK